MAIKKSELYGSLWKSCDELRGGMDASQYKDYVLVLLFVKYVSDKYAGQKDALIDVPPGGGFSDMVALRGDKEIGDKINKIIARLAEANGLKGVIDVADFNDDDKLGKGKEMADRLSNLVGIFNTPALNFRANRAEGDDLLGDAYEYLMRHFATESGKSKGQFYTPAEVSCIMAKVIGIGGATSADQTVYDPTCGSGSLLLKAHDEAESHTGLDITIYGQEMDNATAALARMNMILHDRPTADIARDNSLSTPRFTGANGGLKTFDFAVANPPFSTKAWSNGFNPAEDEYGRFAYGIPPAKNGDYAFLLHILASLKSGGKGAVILPHGVLFRGGAEGAIRKNIVCRGLIKGIIGLPANLFYGTSIPACVIVLDKEHSHTRKGVFMVDAARGFVKDGAKNRLRAQDIHRIVDTFTRQAEIRGYARLVPLAEIEANDFNLNIPRYIDGGAREDLQDIEAHLKGGIPDRDIDDIARYWQVLPGLRSALFAPTGRAGYSQPLVAASEVKAAIFGHAEFAAFTRTVDGLPRSLRGTSGKKPGGQPGHRGAHLRLVDTPDHIVVRRPLVCPACATSLAAEEVDGLERRQVVEAPPVRARVTAYQSLRVRCPHCQTAVTGTFPPAVSAPVQDGPRLRALTVYLTHQQLRPYGRTRAVLRDLLDCAVSQGLVAALAQEAAERLAPVEGLIADALRAGPVLHNDETGLSVRGTRWWLHTASTARLTHDGVHPKREAAATDAIGILPGFGGTSVHDGWAPYRQYACRHALCNAHHLRELAWVEEHDNQAWAGALATLLRQIKQTVDATRDQGQAALPARARRRFRQRYTRLLAEGRAANPPPPDAGPPRRGRRKQSKAKNVLDRLQRADEVLAFMEDIAIPFDNNQAEQDVRMVKVQQKVSGTFRSEARAYTFARLRGYLSTLPKQGLPALAALESVFHGHPLVPSLTS